MKRSASKKTNGKIHYSRKAKKAVSCDPDIEQKYALTPIFINQILTGKTWFLRLKG